MASAEQRKSNGENKVKLADIAKQTGYSLATVSKALNGKADISEAARQAIDKALKDNGYIRRVSLSRKQRTIEVVFRDFETIWALEVLRGIITEAKPHNINVMVAESGDRQHPDSSWVEGIIDRQPIGSQFAQFMIIRIAQCLRRSNHDRLSGVDALQTQRSS